MTTRKFIQSMIVQLALLSPVLAPLVFLRPSKAEPPQNDRKPKIRLEKAPVQIQPVPIQSPRVENTPEKFILDDRTCSRNGCFCIGSKSPDGKITEFKCSEEVPTDGKYPEKATFR